MNAKPKTIEEHLGYLFSIVRLKLFFLARWQKDHPEEDFIQILRERIDIIRKTDINPEALNPVGSYFGLPETAVEEMTIRSRIAKIVSYDALVDTDHNSYRDFSYEFGEDYTLEMSRYGSPSLYLMEEDLKNEKLLKNLQSLKDVQK